MRFNLARFIIFAGMLVVMTGVPSALMAQSSRDMANRLERLENEIETLNRSVYRGEESREIVRGSRGNRSSGGAAAQANTEIRIQQMESEVQSLRGQLEEQGYEIRKLRQKIEAMSSGVETRLGDLEKGKVAVGGGVDNSASAPISAQSQSFEFSSNAPLSPAVSSGAPSDLLSSPSNASPSPSDQSAGSLGVLGGVPGQDSAAGLYENAFSLLKAANYDGAGAGFAEFLKKYPDHVLSGNAKYWLGETHYVRKEFDVAARIFAEGFQQYPNGAKAADNLLKLGMSLANLGNKDDACVALAQLGKDEYKNAGPVVRRGEQERARLKCDG